MDRPKYDDLIAKGVSPRLAEMLSCGQAPGLATDTQFVRNVRTPFGLPNTKAGRLMAYNLKKAGADPNGVYLGGLAKHPGDPKAVVRGRDDIKAVCKSRGWGCEGTVNVPLNRDNVDPGKPVGVAPDLVERHVEAEAAKDPGCVATPKKRQKTIERVKDRITPHWAKKA